MTDKTQAPERLWTNGNVNSGSWNAVPASTSRVKLNEIEYIRADLVCPCNDEDCDLTAAYLAGAAQSRSAAEIRNEALEEAAHELESRFVPEYDGFDMGWNQSKRMCAYRIRALKSNAPKPAESDVQAGMQDMPMLRRAYLAGCIAGIEGFNKHDPNKPDYEAGPEWRSKRDADIRKLINQANIRKSALSDMAKMDAAEIFGDQPADSDAQAGLSVPKPETYDHNTENVIASLLSRGADRLRLVDDFPYRCGLDMPLNDPDDGESVDIATLETKDSGYAPALWRIALAVLRHRRALAEKDGA